MTRLQWLEIDVRDLGTASELHLALRDALGFPQWYGCNWDAFWDAISGLVDMPLQLRIRGWHSLSQRLPDDARLLEQCLLRLQSQYPAWAADLQFD
ncbi:MULTISPECIES: barstar family protein [Pseudomonas]|uniref:barstar family protein n=1 Tax=Pseudomonas TaxID=286 RepID=UPI001BCB112F|nr:MULTISPECIES: barstar family protein [Pseudomonas]MBS7561872.1 barstar family protein [Pseudomonas sp. RC4D1]MCY7262178.1 barstar family protein [Pseudomonas protegens]